MRETACVPFLLFGIWTASIAAQQEYRGMASYRTGYDIESTTYKKSENPRMFRNVLNWEWCVSGGWIGVGVLIWLGMRRQDSLDILSPDFKGQSLLDDDSDEAPKKVATPTTHPSGKAAPEDRPC